MSDLIRLPVETLYEIICTKARTFGHINFVWKKEDRLVELFLAKDILFFKHI